VSYQQIRPGGFNVLPPVIKNLIIINGLVLLAQYTSGVWGSEDTLTDFFALHSVQSDLFKPHQLITHLFMHGDFFHFLFNMFALWMFGNMLENLWGSKRFLIFYILCGLGAAAIHLGWLFYEIQPLMRDYASYNTSPSPSAFMSFFDQNGLTRMLDRQQLQAFADAWSNDISNQAYIDQSIVYVKQGADVMLNTPTVGASGAVFGCLAAFGYLFPNTLIYIYFFFPIKAKWFVILYAAAELWMGIRNSGGSVAHFAHLGGALIGFILVWYWNKNNRRTFY
jgi:membrane associated rhomboid family serine protease